MPSFRARIINALLRLTVKPRWRPGLAIEDIRQHTAKMDRRLAKRAGDCPIEQVTIAGVRATWYGAADLAAGKGTLLYLHGGAWCVHLPALYGTFAARLSALTGLRVMLVDYRLAPEHPFPAAVDDCLAVYQSLTEAAGTRPRVIAGDSAGGNLSLVTLMRARDAQLPLPSCAVLLSPATDIALTGPSIRYNEKADPLFGVGAGDLLPSMYCPDLDLTDSLISPLYGNWSDLPPLFFMAGSTEMLLDDSVRAHDRARQAGTDSRIDVWPDMPHVFPLFSMLPEAKQALGDIVAFIERHPPRHAWLENEGRPAGESRTVDDPAGADDAALAVPETSAAL